MILSIESVFLLGRGGTESSRIEDIRELAESKVSSNESKAKAMEK